LLCVCHSVSLSLTHPLSLSRRIFPLSSVKTDDKNQGGEDDQEEGEGGDGEGEEDKLDEDKGGKVRGKEGPDTVSTVDKDETTASSHPTIEKKTLQQTYEDILFHVGPCSRLSFDPHLSTFLPLLGLPPRSQTDFETKVSSRLKQFQQQPIQVL
jgi:hypothetical protein